MVENKKILDVLVDKFCTNDCIYYETCEDRRGIGSGKLCPTMQQAHAKIVEAFAKMHCSRCTWDIDWLADCIAGNNKICETRGTEGLCPKDCKKCYELAVALDKICPVKKIKTLTNQQPSAEGEGSE